MSPIRKWKIGSTAGANVMTIVRKHLNDANHVICISPLQMEINLTDQFEYDLNIMCPIWYSRMFHSADDQTLAARSIAQIHLDSPFFCSLSSVHSCLSHSFLLTFTSNLVFILNGFKLGIIMAASLSTYVHIVAMENNRRSFVHICSISVLPCVIRHFHRARYYSVTKRFSLCFRRFCVALHYSI